MLGNAEHLDLKRTCAHIYFDYIAHLDVVGGSCSLAVYDYLLGVAGFVGNGAALDKACDLEVFVQSHIISLSAKSNMLI